MRFVFALLILIPTASFAAKSQAAKPRSDQQLFVMVRKKAPFWLKDKDIELRINKDGTFARDAANTTPVLEGKWKIEKSQLKLIFTESKEVKAWPIDVGPDRTPTINGVTLQAGRYVIE